MRRPIVFISLALSVALVVSLVVGWASTHRPKPSAKVQANPVNVSQEVPEHVMYGFMFQHVGWLNQKAEELEKQGQDASPYRSHYKQSALLNDKEAQVLDQVALDTNRKVKILDDEAKKIIQEIRAQTPGGKLQPGQSIPQVPARLTSMQQQRDEVIRAGIAKLKDGFEESRFLQFQGFVKQEIGSKVTNLLTPGSMLHNPGAITPEMLKNARRVQ
jgi:hypothetical protein